MFYCRVYGGSHSHIPEDRTASAGAADQNDQVNSGAIGVSSVSMMVNENYSPATKKEAEA